MRIDVMKAALKKGDMVLRTGLPDIPDNWRGPRRQAMEQNLVCFQEYIWEDLTVEKIAAKHSVSGSLVRCRLRDGMAFLQKHEWLSHRTAPKPRGSSSSEGRTLSSE